MLTKEELAAPLELFPPMEFCCAYGSSLLPNNSDKEVMVDYIFGVAHPVKWHEENLERNRWHYAKYMSLLGPKTITCVANRIGVGVYFNPFVKWKHKVIKYGVVGMEHLSSDLLAWDKFYIAGRLQKPVYVLVDNCDLRKINAVNLKSALTSALLLSPSEFTEEDLYSKICSLSYMGDLRMFFAEDKNKVKKIVHGSFSQFQALYRPFIEEYIAEGILKSVEHKKAFKQDCGMPSTNHLFSTLPEIIQRRASQSNSYAFCGKSRSLISTAIASRDQATTCTRRALRHLVMVSSVKQAAAGFVAVGGVHAARYLGQKISKFWSSRFS